MEIIIEQQDSIERKIYIAYNEAYRSYLGNIPPTIFMHNFLEEIVKIVEYDVGYIASVHKICNETNKQNDRDIINMEAFYKDNLNEDIIIYHNPTINIDIDSVCMKALYTGEIHIIQNDNVIDIKNEPIREIGSYKSYICVPYQFNGTITGIFGLFRKEISKTLTTNIFKLLGNLVATLQNSYFNLGLSNIHNDKKFITYQLLDDILNTIHDGVLIVDADFNIIHTNLYASQLFTELYEDIIFDNLLKIFPQLSMLDDNYKKILKNRKIEINISDKNREKKLEFVFNTVICSGHFFHLATIHQLQNNDINEKNKSNNKYLIAYLSHELRNPLQSISLANHLIKTNIKTINVSPKLTSHIETVNKSCQDMKKIINDILDLSRIEANELVIDMEICDVNETIDSIIDENAIDAINKGLTLSKFIDDDVPKTIYTDITRIYQILNNLISNAIKYSTKGNVILKVSYDKVKNGINFDVIDEGLGIKKDEVCNLFKTYGQTSNNCNKKVSSQGLGLCVSQRIANLLGGYITVKSEHMVGSTFSFYQPIKLEVSGNKYENFTFTDKLSGNILLVDDNCSNLSLLHMLLDQFNYEFTWTLRIESINNGIDAINLCKINKYDLIFMDINMDGIDGCTTSKIIKNNSFAGIIVATTGNILSRAENRDINVSGQFDEFHKYFDDVIIKPFDDQVVLKVLKKFLSNT
jgi:signal transduction histidine kinase